ncbi:MAG: ribosome biogenesis factor YjgA [Burkholderiales bacterium]
MTEHQDNTNDEIEIVSKTQKKQQMQDLQELGEALIKLPADKLDQLDLPEKLLAAINDAKRMTKHGALNRQQQYIGKLMRGVDAEPIRAKMLEWGGKAGREAALFHLAERWRDQLLDNDEALTKFSNDYPKANLQQLRTLLRASRHEIETKRPLTNFRNLFRELFATVTKYSI